jgi:hypothetical protein
VYARGVPVSRWHSVSNVKGLLYTHTRECNESSGDWRRGVHPNHWVPPRGGHSVGAASQADPHAAIP